LDVAPKIAYPKGVGKIGYILGGVGKLRIQIVIENGTFLIAN